MFLFHVAMTLGLIAFSLGMILFMWGLRNQGVGVQLAKTLMNAKSKNLSLFHLNQNLRKSGSN